MCKIQLIPHMTKAWIPPLLLLILGGYFLTTNLGNISLMPWDEAWYAVIARNLVRTHQVLRLDFNGSPYFDHPPLGFYAIAASFLLFGANELTARLPMALSGIATILVAYFTGKKLGNKWIGLTAGLILLSCRWFIIRSRTANLEALLLLNQVLSVYFFSAPRKWWHVSLGWLSLSLALLTKSVISITLVPLGVWSTYNAIRNHHQAGKTLLVSLLLFIGPLVPWYGANYLAYGQGFINQSLKIAIRGGTSQAVTLESTQRTLLYLRSAIHKWYLPLLAAIVLSLLLIRRPQVRWLLAYLLLAAFPYFLSSQTEIWHLLPILPPAALLIAYVFYQLRLPPKVVLAGFLLIFAISYSSYWPEFIHLSPYSTFEAQVGLAAHRNQLPVVSQETTYVPTLVYYADLPVKVSPQEYSLATYPRPFQLVTHTYLLDPQLNATVTFQVGDTLVAVVD